MIQKIHGVPEFLSGVVNPYNRLFMKVLAFTISLLLAILAIGCEKKAEESAKQLSGNRSVAFPGKKILFLDSYHESYEPNIKSRRAMENELKDTGASIVYRYLDEKNTSDTAILHQRGLAIFNEIASITPDVIVLADDPIMKWVAEPFLMNQKIPLVFIGVNWEYPPASQAPLTGQLEVEVLSKLVSDLQQFARGSRIGILTARSATDEKSISAYKDVLGISFAEQAFVTTFDDWKREFRRLQNEVDLLIVRQNSGISGWDDREAQAFCLAETLIPTGSPNLHMSPYTLLCYPKDNGEFGEYAGKTIVKILSGTPPQSLPYEKNIRSNRTLNTRIAKKLGITFSADFLESANFVSAFTGKIAFINSYHRGYEWSDKIEQAFLKSIGVSDFAGKDEYNTEGLHIRFFYLDGKKNPAKELVTKRSKETFSELNQWKPDLIIAADDDAAKYLVVPHYINTDQPVLFCGLNWDASVYGFPTSNIRGMVEVAPVRELIEFLVPLAKGKRIGYIGADVLSEAKELDHYKNTLKISFHDGGLVKSVEAWKNLYCRLQTTCDVVIILSYVGIPDWNNAEMEKFVINETKVPSGTTTTMIRRIALVSFARLAEEQGWWAGEQARAVLSGKPISEIAMTKNVRSVKYVHTELMKRLSIKIPTSLIDSSFFIDDGKAQ